MLASYKRYWQPNYLQATSLSLFAGTVATSITYPLDFLKTVSQFRGQGIGMRGLTVWQLGISWFRVMNQMHSYGGGFQQFYGGFQAHLTGRLGYLFIRNSIYKVIYDAFKPKKPSNDLTNRQKMLIAGLAGGIAAYVTSPFQLISIRTILDSQIKSEWRRNYTSVFSAYSSLKQSGQAYNGVWANVLRHIVLNISLTGPYDFIHQRLWIIFGDYGHVKPLALITATAFASVVTLPFDNARTRLMQLHKQNDRNRFHYTGIVDVFEKIVRYQSHRFSPWMGYHAFFLSNLLYAYVTLELCEAVTYQWKKQKKLESWQY